MIVSTLGSFHGRTFGSLSATGQLSKHKGFEPLVPGFEHVPYDDLAALERACDSRTRRGRHARSHPGRGGSDRTVCRISRQGSRDLDERGILLVLDEVQTGLGRTGRTMAIFFLCSYWLSTYTSSRASCRLVSPTACSSASQAVARPRAPTILLEPFMR